MTKDPKDSIRQEVDPLRAQYQADLRNEVEKEFDKRKIVEELTAKKAPEKYKFLGHPAFLLLAGFFFTTVLGTVFSSSWQQRQSRLEQARLTRQAVIKQKYDIKDEVIKAVAETNTAAEDLLASFEWTLNESHTHQKEMKERNDNWQNASRNWRTNSKTILENLRFRFVDTKIRETFEEVIKERSRIGRQLLNLRGTVDSTRGQVLENRQLGYPLFDEDSFKDLPGLVAKLRGGSDRVSRYLSARLPKSTRDLLNKEQDPKSPLLVQTLILNFNDLLRSGSLYESKTFADVKLNDNVRLLLRLKNHKTETRAWLNRLLIESAYQAEISPASAFEDEVSSLNKALKEMQDHSRALMDAMTIEIRGDENKED